MTVRVNEEEALRQQLDELVQEEQFVKQKYREREQEVDQELVRCLLCVWAKWFGLRLLYDILMSYRILVLCL